MSVIHQNNNTLSVLYQIQLFLIPVFFIGFMYSRAILSISMILSIGVGAIILYQDRQQWKLLKKQKWVHLLIIFFAIHLISGFWAANQQAWLADVQLKLPLLLFPVALFSYPLDDEKFQQKVVLLMQIVLALGMLYSLYLLIQNIDKFMRGHHFKGPADYLRFGVILLAAMNLSIYQYLKDRKSTLKLNKNVAVFFVVLVIIYSHLQASKLVLLALYASLGVYAFAFLLKKYNLFKVSLITIGAMLLLFIPLFKLPTFKKQIEVTKLEYEIYMSGDEEQYAKKELNSFLPRILSYEMAYEVIKESVFTGIGAGNVRPAIEEKYAEYHPKVIPLTPHNQFFNSAVGVGVPAALLILIVVLFPLFYRGHLFAQTNALIFLIATMIEAMLEVQNGLFIFLFFSLWFLVLKEKNK